MFTNKRTAIITGWCLPVVWRLSRRGNYKSLKVVLVSRAYYKVICEFSRQFLLSTVDGSRVLFFVSLVEYMSVSECCVVHVNWWFDHVLWILIDSKSLCGLRCSFNSPIARLSGGKCWLLDYRVVVYMMGKDYAKQLWLVGCRVGGMECTDPVNCGRI